MKRIELVHLLEGICPVGVISSIKEEVTSKKIVLVKGTGASSLNNSLCGWDNWDVILLVPSKSIILLDMLYDDVCTLLKKLDGVEFIHDGWGDERYDDSIKAYYKTIRIRFPREL